MKPTTARTILGWLAAALLNVGPLLFIAGLLFPHESGVGFSPVLLVGVGLTIAGLVILVAWFSASRRLNS